MNSLALSLFYWEVGYKQTIIQLIFISSYEQGCWEINYATGLATATLRKLLGRKAVTDLDSILKSRDITLLTKVHIVKAIVFPVVIYGCESWAIKKAEHQRIDAFELWYWRRLLRIPWTARRSNQSILKEIRPEYSLKVKVKSLSHVQIFATPWAVAYQAPPAMGFSRQEYWSGLPFPPPEHL